MKATEVTKQSMLLMLTEHDVVREIDLDFFLKDVASRPRMVTYGAVLTADPRVRKVWGLGLGMLCGE